jgi:hypothetical protein
MTDNHTTPHSTPGDASPGPGESGPDPRVLAMARAFDRTRRKVEGLEKNVNQLAADVTRLAGVFTGDHRPGGDPTGGETGEQGAGGPPTVRSWLLGGDPEQAVTDLADLIEWLDRIYLRYPGTELAACWLWHPHVIEELWWLRRAHAAAYHPEDGSWVRVGDWHDRQRPGVVRRVREAIGKCDLSLHTPGKPQGRPPQVAPLAAHAAQIAAAWAADSSRPEPTMAQLDEAAAYLQALLRSMR